MPMLSKLSREWRDACRLLHDGKDEAAIEAAIETISESGEFEWSNKYGDRGRTIEEGKRGILIGNWNDVPDTLEALLEAHYELEWSDMVTVDHDDDMKVYGTEPDWFGWLPSFVYGAPDPYDREGRIVPWNEIESEFTREQTWYVEEYLRNHDRVMYFKVPLEHYGFTKLDEVHDRSSWWASLKNQDNATTDYIVDGTEGSFLYVWTRAKIRVTEKDEGCYADCSRGHYVGVEVIRVALNLGWHPYGYCRNGVPLEEWRDFLMSRAIADHESYCDIWDEAETWLNEKHCPENYSWGNTEHSGDFGLWKRSNCAECSNEFSDEDEGHWPMCAECHGKQSDEESE